MEKNWQLASPLTASDREKFPELPAVVLQLLWNRGINTQEKIDEFLNPDYSTDIHDPFLFQDMKKTVERINQAIAKDELIVIHGDYDADGVCASAILYSTLKILGAKHLDVFLPDRELEGYGVNKNTIEVIASAQTKLLITCDCGISNKPEVELANQLGMDVIITDHHTVPKDLPPAYSIIHSKMPGDTYPDQGLSGGAVAFKLTQALLKSQNKVDGDKYEKWLLDLVAISLVGDMMPLVGEARTLTRYGLIVLNKTKRLGLKHLIEIARLNKDLNTHNIGFQIAPRLNAAGRMKHANTALQLLLTEDNDEALELARELDSNNQKRQKETAKMMAEAEEIITKEKQTDNPVIFVLHQDWPIGLIGLVASRLCDAHYRPVIVMTQKDGYIQGSGRSIDEINIISKITELKKYFAKFGGHPQACGFTFTEDADLTKFKDEFSQLVGTEIKKKKIVPILPVDAVLDLNAINWDMYDLLQKFEPFGEANPEPSYWLKGLQVAGVDSMGAQNQHLKLLVKQDNGVARKIVGFCFGDEKKAGKNWCTALKPGDIIDAVVQISVNEWNGNRELQLKLIDIKKI